MLPVKFATVCADAPVATKAALSASAFAAIVKRPILCVVGSFPFCRYCWSFAQQTRGGPPHQGVGHSAKQDGHDQGLARRDAARGGEFPTVRCFRAQYQGFPVSKDKRTRLESMQ